MALKTERQNGLEKVGYTAVANSDNEKNPEGIWEEKLRSDADDQLKKHRIPRPEEGLDGAGRSVSSISELTRAMAKLQVDTALKTKAEDLKLRQSVANPNFSYMGMPLGGLARWFKPDEAVNLSGYMVTCGFFYVGEFFSSTDRSFKPGLIRPSRMVQVAKTKFEKSPDKVLATSTFLESEHQIYRGGYENLDATARDVYLQWLANDRQGKLLAPGPLLVFLCGVEQYALQTNLYEDRQFLQGLLPIIAELERLIDEYDARNWQAIDIAKSLCELMKALCQIKGVKGFNPRYHLLRGRTANMSGTGLEEKFIPCARVFMDIWVALEKKKAMSFEVMFELAKSFGVSNGRYLKNPVIQDIILKHWRRIYDANQQGEQRFLIPTTNRDKGLAIHYESPATQNFRVFAKGYSRTFFSDYQKNFIVTNYDKAVKDVGYAAELLMLGENPASMDVLAALPGIHCWPATPVHLNAVRSKLADPPVPMPVADFLAMIQLKQYYKQNRFGLSQILARYEIGVVPTPTGWGETPPLDVVPYAIPLNDLPMARTVHRTSTARENAMSIMVGVLYFLFEKGEVVGNDAEPKIRQIIHEIVGAHDPVTFALAKAEAALLAISKPKSAAYYVNRIEKHPDHMNAYGFVGAVLLFVREHLAYPAVQIPHVVRFLTAIDNDEDAAIRLVGHTRESFALLQRKAPREKKKKLKADATAEAAESSLPFVVSIDHSQVAAIEQETGEVAELMAAIFTDDDSAQVSHPAGALLSQTAAVVETKPAASDPHAEQTPLLGLSKVHSKLLATMLAEGDVISRSTYLGFCRELGLMPESALEAINEAGFEAHGMAIFEGEDPLERNPDIAL